MEPPSWCWTSRRVVPQSGQAELRTEHRGEAVQVHHDPHLQARVRSGRGHLHQHRCALPERRGACRQSAGARPSSTTSSERISSWTRTSSRRPSIERRSRASGTSWTRPSEHRVLPTRSGSESDITALIGSLDSITLSRFRVAGRYTRFDPKVRERLLDARLAIRSGLTTSHRQPREPPGLGTPRHWQDISHPRDRR